MASRGNLRANHSGPVGSGPVGPAQSGGSSSDTRLPAILQQRSMSCEWCRTVRVGDCWMSDHPAELASPLPRTTHERLAGGGAGAAALLGARPLSAIRMIHASDYVTFDQSPK